MFKTLLLCSLGFHDFIERGEHEETVELPEGWVGNAGKIVVKDLSCSRDKCGASKEEVLGNYHVIKFCAECDKETRQEHRMLSDIGGWDKWYGQGDRRDYFKCIECGSTWKLLYGSGGECTRTNIEWPKKPSFVRT